MVDPKPLGDAAPHRQAPHTADKMAATPEVLSQMLGELLAPDTARVKAAEAQLKVKAAPACAPARSL